MHAYLLLVAVQLGVDLAVDAHQGDRLPLRRGCWQAPALSGFWRRSFAPTPPPSKTRYNTDLGPGVAVGSTAGAWGHGCWTKDTCAMKDETLATVTLQPSEEWPILWVGRAIWLQKKIKK